LFAVLIAVFQRNSYFFSLPFPSALGRHLFDKFVHSLGMSFQFVLIPGSWCGAKSANPFAAIVD